MESKHGMLMTPEFVFFWDGPFSQWHSSPFSHNGLDFAHAEQWMMAQKASLFCDDKIRAKIMKATSPAECKYLGKQVQGFDNTLWKNVRLQIVIDGNLLKFRQNERLKKILLDTGGRIIVEASPHDDIWGIGIASNAFGVENPENWKGLNLLGIVLMTVRHMLAAEVAADEIDG